MKQFSYFVENHASELYPNLDGLTDDFKNAVAMWFLSREVCNDVNFIRFFQRVIIRDFGQYLQLLRIEPNIAEYDWLVQNYNEAMTETTGTTSETRGNTKTNNLTDSNTRTNNLTDTKSASETGTDEQTVTYGNTDTRTATDALLHGHKTVTAGDTLTIASGSDSTARDTASDTKGLAKDNPMSISYQSGVDIAGGDSLAWDYPSAQTEQATTTDDDTVVTYGRRDTGTTSAETTNSGTDTRSISDALAHTGTVGTERETSKGVAETDTHTGTVTDVGTHTGTVTDAGTASGTKSDVRKHINTGRNIDVSTLLMNATSFIINSSAFEWMRQRLEPCFMAIYDDDYLEGVLI